MYQMMKYSVSCLVLWMLLFAVNAEIINFAGTSTIPAITTPRAEMASRRPSGGEGASGDGADALDVFFHQMAQGLLRLQEALRLQQQHAERRAQEVLRLQQHRAETALRDAERHMEQKLRDRDEAMRRLREECSSSIQRIETKVKRMEEQFVPSTKREEGGHVSITQLKTRMETMEAKLKEAFEQLFPNMEALIEHLKRFSSSEAHSAVTVAPTAPSNLTSIVTSSSASMSTSPSPLPFPSPHAKSPTSVSSPNSTSPTASISPPPTSSHSPSLSFTTPIATSLSSPNSTSSSTSPRLPAACDEECEKQQLQLRMREVKKRPREGPNGSSRSLQRCDQRVDYPDASDEARC